MMSKNTLAKNNDEIIILKIYGSFEKLIGIAINDVNHGDFNSANQAIILINDKIIEILNNKQNPDLKEKTLALLNFKRFPFRTGSSQESSVKSKNDKFDTLMEIYLNGIYEIWKTGYNKGNKEICYNTLNNLVNTLYLVSSDVEFSNIADSILNCLNQMVWFGSTTINHEVNFTVSLSSFRWYESWCYRKVSSDDYDNEVFLLKQYQARFQTYLWSFLKIIIEKNQQSAIDSFISSVFNGFHLPSVRFDSGLNIFNSFIFQPKFQEELQNLNFLKEKFKHCFDIKDFENYWNEFITFYNDLNEKVYSSFTEDDIKIQKGAFLRAAIGTFLFNRLQELVINLGAFSLFLGKSDFIFKLWNYLHPADSTAINIGHKILPESVHEILDSYQRINQMETPFFYPLGGRNEITGFSKKYHALLIYRLYIIQKVYSFQDFLDTNGIVQGIKDENIEAFIRTSEEILIYIKQIQDDKKLLKALKLSDIQNRKPDPEQLMMELIASLKERKDDHDKSVEVSDDKEQNFRENLIKGLQKEPGFRNIFKNYEIVKTEVEEYVASPLAFGINEVSAKAYFADIADKNFEAYCDRYVQEIIFQENNFIRTELIKQCKKGETSSLIKGNEIFSIIKEHYSEDMIVIGRNIPFIYEVFEESTEFTSKTKPKESEKEMKCLSVPGFVGLFKNMEIYNLYDDIGWRNILILNKSAIGILINYKPFPDVSESDMKDYLFVKVTDIAKSPEILNALIENPSNWLLAKGEKADQETFLKKQVRIQIAEKIKIEFNDTFKGYHYDIKD